MKVGKERHGGEVQVPIFQDVKQTEESDLEGARRNVRECARGRPRRRRLRGRVSCVGKMFEDERRRVAIAYGNLSAARQALGTSASEDSVAASPTLPQARRPGPQARAEPMPAVNCSVSHTFCETNVELRRGKLHHTVNCEQVEF
jgi:hypothetical protein